MAFRCTKCKMTVAAYRTQCLGCRCWNTLKAVEDAGLHAVNGGFAEDGDAEFAEGLEPVPLAKVRAADVVRVKTGWKALDEFVGGGFVVGCVYILSGDPGAGKSTLWLQAVEKIQGAVRAVLAEEWPEAIKARAERLGLKKVGHISVVHAKDIDEGLLGGSPAVFNIIDSAHTMTSVRGSGRAGTPQQLGEVMHTIIDYTEETRGVSLVIGHVNKSGGLKGEMEVPHAVACQMHIAKEAQSALRRLSVEKNRHGATDEEVDGEILPLELIFKMGARGLEVMRRAESEV